MQKSKILSLLLLFIFLIPSIIGLLHSGFFLSDDGNWMIIRFSAFYDALRHGQFPVRFLPRLNHEYGYPVADFLYPGFMYLGVLIHGIGFNFVNTIKIILGGSLLFSSIFAFEWLRKKFAVIPSLVGALAYVYFPYHLWDVYHRGSVGEVLALAVIPFIFWQIEKKNLFFVSLGIASLILSHNTLALLFLPIIIVSLFLNNRNKFGSTITNSDASGFWISRKQNRSIVLSILSGLGLSLFFWFPAIYDTRYTVFSHIAVSSFANYFLKDEALIGAFSLIILILSLLLFVKRREKETVFFFSIAVIGIFFALPFSSVLWDILPLGKLVQFPFRFLSITMVGISFLSATILDRVSKKLQAVAGIIFLLMMLVSSWKFVYPGVFQNYPNTFYSTNEDTTTVKNEYMPKWVRVIPSRAPLEKVTVSGGTITNLLSNAKEITFTVQVKNPTTITVNIIYFPGWKVWIDGKEATISYQNVNGVIEFPLRPGTHFVKVAFNETTVRLICDLVSLVILVSLCGFILMKNRNTKK